jgi:hypothetical protein
MATFKTTILMEDARCFECEIPVKITYSISAGYAGDRINPPEGASVEITAIEAYGPEFGGVPIPDRFLTDDGLIAECFDDDEAEYENAMERRAEQRRDDLMREKF